ncbi:MAG: hypothetical protein D6784_18075 [Chloroflexi bacterium]|nr:MAG: hypothetical protein D6784_18075 [Chloroflexota bacterium]
MSQSQKTRADEISETVDYYLGRAMWLVTDQDRFPESFQAIEKARKFARNAENPDLLARIASREDSIQQIYHRRRGNLIKKIKDLLNRPPVEITPVDQTEAAEILHTLQQMEIEKNEETAKLKEAWEKHSEQARRVRAGRFAQYIQEAEALMKENLFASAGEKLQEAGRWADDDQQRGIIAAQRESLEKRRRIYADWLKREMEPLFARPPETLTEAELRKGEETLQELAACLQDSIEKDILLERDILLRRWAAYRTYRQDTLDLRKVEQEVKTLWDAPALLVSQYDQAVQIAQEALKKQSGAREKEFQDLLAEAQKRHQQAQNDVNALLDKANAGEFEPLLTEMEQLARQGCTKLPGFKWEEGQLTAGELIEAGKAIAQLKSLAQAYAQKKAQALTNEAWKNLESDPQQAVRLLEEAQSLPFLPPEEKQRLQTFYQDKAAPALAQHAQARQFLERARQKRETDVEEAWDFLQEAYRLAPGLEEVKTERRYMLPWLRVHLNKRLREADDFLREQQPDQARPVLEQVLERTRHIPEAEDIHRKADKLYQTLLQKTNHS